ncbi:GGDEF domain-containing protein [Vibrio sp. SCSIO 43137]|uniref:GGDEF domain-containing protein n=1 Tax=Vibrio sp. SCSIO 43137 TaxID=3021011 RepID=UPI002307D010|nr:GGDEF domain-containing protein [Vibrio sp. SCSIO 43137]WCE31436.1 GGDEF domain-containing protein [Vibrio sp. SCSIO 43137]
MIYFDAPMIEYGIIVSAIIPALISYPSFLLVWSLILRLYEAERKMADKANHDPLTLLPNRRCFDVFIDELLKEHHNKKISGTLFLVDIDNFKLYNDFYGHQQGDVCLQVVSQVLQRELKGLSGMIARYGGEEFIILMLNTSIEDSHRLGSRLCKAISEENISHKSNSPIKCVTVSVGGAYCNDLIREKYIDGLLSLADKHLYDSKSKGRNRFIM